MQRTRACWLIAPALFMAACARKPQPPPDITVTFLNVGQADAALIRTPENDTILVDTGRDSRTAELLRSQGVTEIDLLILSHAHPDAAGGLSAILDAFPVHEIWYSGLDYSSQFRGLIERAEKYEAVQAGARKELGKLTLTAFHPESLPLRSHSASVNDHSLVVKARYPSADYLFPGDCEHDCWASLVTFHASELRADVLKAPNHGSSEGLAALVLNNVRPKTVVVSCGANEEGLPQEDALAMAQQAGARILRTDQQGAIRCVGVHCSALR
jgi:competence protein ComEC